MLRSFHRCHSRGTFLFFNSFICPLNGSSSFVMMWAALNFDIILSISEDLSFPPYGMVVKGVAVSLLYPLQHILFFK